MTQTMMKKMQIQKGGMLKKMMKNMKDVDMKDLKNMKIQFRDNKNKFKEMKNL